MRLSWFFSSFAFGPLEGAVTTHEVRSPRSVRSWRWHIQWTSARESPTLSDPRRAHSAKAERSDIFLARIPPSSARALGGM